MKKLSANQFNSLRESHWRPRYTSFSHKRMLRKLDDIINALDEQGIPYAGPDVDNSYLFIDRVFAQFRGNEKIEPKLFAFVVPTRITAASDEYSSESFELMPILKYVDSKIRQRMIVGTPPCVVETYHHDDMRRGGCVVFAPVYQDMQKDIRTKLLQYRAVKSVMKQTTDFIEKRVAVEVIGLGATLPKLTKLGLAIKNKSFETTTGHGGTVWLILKLYEKIIAEYKIDTSLPVGVIGGGAIGASTAEMILEQSSDSKVLLHDKRPDVNKQLLAKMHEKYGKDRFAVAKSNQELIEQCQIMVSAITGKIDLDTVSVSMKGKVIIDDSQPGSFDAEQANKRGAGLVWVVGRDNSKQRYATRQSGLNFGDEGLVSANDVWGCEAEVATIAVTRNHHHTIKESVQPHHVVRLHDSFMDQGIGIAPFQQKGTLVDLSKFVDKR